MNHSSIDTLPVHEKIWNRSFMLLFLASLLLFTAFYFLLPTLPLYLINHLGIDAGKTGIVLGLYTIAALLVRPFTGMLLDRYGRKILFIPAFFLFALLYAVYAFAATFIAFAMLRFMHGIFWGVTTTSNTTLVVDVIPAKRRGEGIGLFGLSMTIPMALGPLIGIRIVDDGHFERLFLGAGLLTLTGAFLALRIKYPGVPRKSGRQPFSLSRLLEKSALPAGLNLLLLMISYGGVITFISVYAASTGIGHTGTFFAVFAAGITLARLVTGKVFDRRGPLLIGISGIFFYTTGFLFLAFVPTLPGMLAAGALMGLGNGVILPTLQTMVNNMAPPQNRGAANSTLFTGLDMGIGAGMILTGFLQGLIGLQYTYFIFFCINALSGLLFLTGTVKKYRMRMHLTS